MDSELVVLDLTLHGRRVDGAGTITHPLHEPTFDAALRTWQRLQVVTADEPWEWTVVPT